MNRMLMLFGICLALSSSQALANSDSKVIVLHAPEAVAANLAIPGECPVGNTCEQPCSCFSDSTSSIAGAVSCSCVPSTKGPFATK